MRITKQQLQDIIDEEVDRRLTEANQFVLKETMSDLKDIDLALKDIDLAALIAFAKAYVRMGEDVQASLDELLMNANMPYDHRAAMVMRRDLEGMSDELDAMLSAWRENGRRR